MKKNKSVLQNVNDLSGISQRFLRVLDEKNTTGYKLQKDNTGISSTQISHIKSGRNQPSFSLIEKLLKIFPDVSRTWLLTGEGEMIHMEGKSLDQNFSVQEPSHNYKKDSVTQISHDKYMEVEFRDLSVAGGPLNRDDVAMPKKTMLIPKEFDRGEYLVVRVDGPSMDDGSIYSIPSGANILIKRYYLENGDMLPIKGNLFVIDAVDGQALKQITEHNTEEGYIICHSYNPEFKDYRVDMEDIIGIYIFRKIVGFRPPVRDV